MFLAVDQHNAAAKSRIVAIRLATVTLRCMENWRREAGGYDEAMILVAVVAITSERFVRKGLPDELENLEQSIPGAELGHCNISSIAAATGLNRETARRKVRQLVDAGFLVRVGRTGVMFRQGVLQEKRILDLVRAQLEVMARAADNLLRDGVLTVTARPGMETR